MINFLAALLGGRVWLAWLIVAGLGLGGLAAGYAWIDHQGYRRAELEWTVKYDKREIDLNRQRFIEIDRQATANAAAKAREAAALAQMAIKNSELQALIDDQAVAAAQDPDRDRISFSAAAVERINNIK